MRAPSPGAPPAPCREGRHRREQSKPNSRPITAPICASPSRPEPVEPGHQRVPQRVRHGAASGSPTNTYRPSSIARTPDSSSDFVTSSTNRGTPSVFSTICLEQLGGERPSSRDRRDERLALRTGPAASSRAVDVRSPLQRGSKSGRCVSTTSNGRVSTLVSSASSASRVDGSAQWTSSKIISRRPVRAIASVSPTSARIVSLFRSCGVIAEPRSALRTAATSSTRSAARPLAAGRTRREQGSRRSRRCIDGVVPTEAERPLDASRRSGGTRC